MYTINKNSNLKRTSSFILMAIMFINIVLITITSSFSYADNSSGWNFSGAEKSGNFDSSAGGSYSTTAEVVGDEIIWKISVTHGYIRGSSRYVQGISVGDIQTSDIKEMTSNTKGDVYPPATRNITRGMWRSNPEQYSYKQATYSNNAGDTTTFVVRQPISDTDIEKKVVFKAAIINTSDNNAYEPSGEISLVATRTLPTTGNIKFAPKMADGTQVPYGVSAKIGDRILNSGESVELNAPGEYKVEINSIPEGYELSSNENEQVLSLQTGENKEVEFLLKKSEEPKGQLIIFAGAAPGQSLPQGITAVIDGTNPVLVGETKELSVGTHTVKLNIPEGWKMFAGSTETQTVEITEGKMSYLFFSLEQESVAPQPQETGSIKIVATDVADNNIKIKDAVFNVDGNGQTYTKTTNENGEAIFENLPNGSYTVTQESAPDGYVKWSETKTFDIQGHEAVLVVQNGKTPGGGQPPVTPGLGTIGVLVRDMDTNEPIEGAKIEAKDRLGNTHYGITDASGNAYITDLSLTQSYDLKAVKMPFYYGENHVAFDNVNFVTPGTGPYVQTFYWAKKNTTNMLNVIVHEEGDGRVTIPGAVIEITDQDGNTITRTTGSDGAVHEELHKGTYTIVQKTTDGKHIVNNQVINAYMGREETFQIPNKLIDPSSEKRTITVNKVWGDPAPTPRPDVVFDLYADGTYTGESQTISGTSGTNTVSFVYKDKYNFAHQMIKYTVKEREINDYYAVYEKNDVDGYSWTATNYEGSQVGECSKGNFWVSTNNMAYEVYPDGTSTGNYLDMSYRGRVSDDDSHGYGIAVSQEHNLMFGLNKHRKLAIWDLNTKQRISDRIEMGMDDSSYGFFVRFVDFGHALEVSRDGTKLFSKSWITKKIYVYNISDIIKPGVTSVRPIQVITGSETSAGDIVELENGDLLFSGGSTTIGKGVELSTGLYIHKKNSNGTYQSAKKIGDVNDSIGAEGMAMVGDKVLVTGIEGSNYNRKGYVYELSPTPRAEHSGVTYQKTKYGTVSISGNYSDMHGATQTTCSSIVQIAGNKIWEDDSPENRPESITVQLYANGVALPGKTLVVRPDANGNWTYKFEGLDKFGPDGKRIVYSVKEVGTPPGYVVSYPDPVNEPNNYNITNRLATGNLFILKKAENSSAALAGAEFTLYKEDKATVFRGPVSTNIAGAAQFEKLPIGTYYLQETKAPEGYELDQHFYKVDVVQGANGIEVRVTDKNGQVNQNIMYRPFEIMNRLNKGSFDIKKVDAEGYPIASGATFELKDSNGTVIATKVTGTDGFLKFDNLLPGNYTLKETKAPEGYQLTDKVYNVVVNDNGKVTIDGTVKDPLIVVNESPTFDFEFLKISESDKPYMITGAIFELEDKDGVKRIVMSDSTGLVKFTDLKPGTYTLSEPEPVAGHFLLGTTFTLTINEDGSNKLINDSNGEEADKFENYYVIYNVKSVH